MASFSAAFLPVSGRNRVRIPKIRGNRQQTFSAPSRPMLWLREAERVPAYSNLSVEFERENLYPDFMEDFFEFLQQTGLRYLSGYWGS